MTPSAFITFALGVAVGLLWVPATGNANTGPRSVPAEFLYRLVAPGTQNGFLRPSAVFIDRATGEILVADGGKNRIVIFGGDGRYRYEFGGGDRFSLPLDVVADPEGFIYVLASTTTGRRVLRYDFDGTFVSELQLKAPSPDSDVFARSLTIDDSARLLVLDDRQRVSTYRLDGTLEHVFPVLDGGGNALDPNSSLGRITATHDRIFVPVSSRGVVHVFDSRGMWLQSFGYQGTNMGEFSFPIEVAVTDDRLVLVLDKHRFNVLAFDFEGRFRGEFGGRGFRPGWYYHPTFLAVDRDDRVYIGQVYQNRVDVCRIPDFICESKQGFEEESIPVINGDGSPPDILAKGLPIE